MRCCSTSLSSLSPSAWKSVGLVGCASVLEEMESQGPYPASLVRSAIAGGHNVGSTGRTWGRRIVHEHMRGDSW